MDKNSLLYWFPKVKDLGIPTPRTRHVNLSREEKQEYIAGEGDYFDLTRLEREVADLIASEFSFPVFLRTDQFSGKHGWKKTCYLERRGDLKRNLAEIITESALAGTLDKLPLDAIVVREFIPMNSSFKAFHGDMPVNPERRYFIRDGKVLCHHPYWREDAVEEGTRAEYLPKNWKDLAKQMNNESEQEVTLLTDYAQRVANSLGGFWSVDFCQAKSLDWYLIDMAQGEKSWHESDCPHSTMPRKIKADRKGKDMEWANLLAQIKK